MAIEFRCPECNALVRTPDAAAGKKGKCPTCAAVVQIPAGSAPPQSAPANAASAAGKKGKCPKCQTVVQIPATNAQRPATSGGLTFLPEPMHAAAALGGLTPLPADSYGGLTPLDDSLGGDFGAPDMLGANPYSDPFAGPSLGAAPASAPFQPYQAPATGAIKRKPSAAPSRATTIQIGTVIPSAWRMFSGNFGEAILVQLIVVGLTILSYAAVFIGLVAIALIAVAAGGPEAAGGMAIRGVMAGIALIGFLLASAWIQAGYAFWAARLVQGKSKGASEFFRAPQFLHVLGLQFLLSLVPLPLSMLATLMSDQPATAITLNLLGGLLALVLHLLTLPAIYLIVDGGHSVINAITESCRVMAGLNALFTFLIYLIVLPPMIIVAILSCGFGTLAVVPFLFTVQAVIYATATGRRIAA